MDRVGNWIRGLNLPQDIPGVGWLSPQQGAASAAYWRGQLDATGNPVYAVAEGVANLWAGHAEEAILVLGSLRGASVTSRMGLVEAEAVALQRIGRNPSGPDLTSREPYSILLKQAEGLSTAKPNQSVVPRDMQEQTLVNRVLENPSAGTRLGSLQGDVRFSQDAGFSKMQATHRLSDGSSISVHYQYNSITGKAYDIKIVSPQPVPNVLQPGPSVR